MKNKMKEMNESNESNKSKQINEMILEGRPAREMKFKRFEVQDNKSRC